MLRSAIDMLDFHGVTALHKLGPRLCDADETIEAARVIKTDNEVEMMRFHAQSLRRRCTSWSKPFTRVLQKTSYWVYSGTSFVHWAESTVTHAYCLWVQNKSVVS